MQTDAGGSSHTFGTLAQPPTVHAPSRHGSAGRHDVPGLKSLHASRSKFPQVRNVSPSQVDIVHSSVQLAAQVPLLQVVPELQAIGGPHSRQPSKSRSPQLATPLPTHSVSPVAHSSLH